MKLKVDNGGSLIVQELWHFQTPYKFNTLCVGTLFRQKGLYLVIGGEDGIIRMYDQSKSPDFQAPQISLETKGGPIQSMIIEDITKFYHNDLVAIDSCGMMTVFCNQQILCRQSVTDSCLNCLQIQKDKTGNMAVVLSSDSGVICGVLPSDELWRLNINDLSVNQEQGSTVSITCILAVNLPNEQGQRSSYILASDNSSHLYVIHQGSVVMTLKTPSIITAMCHGKFIKQDKLPVMAATTPSIWEDQVALGSETGAIYLFNNFAISEDGFVNAQYPIRILRKLTLPDQDTDFLLCAGHFNALQVYIDGKSVERYKTPDWINSLDIADIDGDDVPEVVIGCLNGTVQAMKITPT